MFRRVDPGNVPVLVLLYRGHGVHEMRHPTGRCPSTEKLANQASIEMIGVVHGVTTARIRQRRAALFGDPVGEKEPVRIRDNVDIVLAQRHIVVKGAHGIVIALGEKRMVIALVARAGRPVWKAYPALIGGVALRHPCVVGDA